MFIKLVNGGYIGRYISYTGEEFKEGVSLSYIDEVGKFNKYTYGHMKYYLHRLNNGYIVVVHDL